MFAMNCIHSTSRDFTQGRQPAKSVKISKTSELQGLHTPQWPLDSLLEIQASVPVIYSQPQRSRHLFPVIYSQPQRSRQLSAALNQLPVSTTRQQHQISISFQPLPPGSSTKSAPASSFHHQAAAPHQSASSKASSQSAVNSTTLPHPHHGSHVCCCLDILLLFSSIVF